MDLTACVLFDAHKLDLFTLTNYHFLRRKLQGICDVYFVLHMATIENGVSYPPNTLVLDDQRIFEKFPSRKAQSKQLIPGNCDLKTVAAIEEIEGYDRYISMEFDCLCIDDPEVAFRRLIEATATIDLAGSYIETQSQSPDWMWWSSIRPPDEIELNPSDLRRSFLPVGVYSRRFIEAYRIALSEGWEGHQEVLLPTLATQFGMNLLALNHSKLRFTSWPAFDARRPQISDPTRLPSFVHPVKNLEAFNELLSSIKNSPPLRELNEMLASDL